MTEYNESGSGKKPMSKKKKIIIAVVALVVVAVLAVGFFPLDCPACGGTKKSDYCIDCSGENPNCESCHGFGNAVCFRCDGEGTLPLFFR